jgi:DNA-binding CsgD family transcriptional regulator
MVGFKSVGDRPYDAGAALGQAAASFRRLLVRVGPRLNDPRFLGAFPPETALTLAQELLGGCRYTFLREPVHSRKALTKREYEVALLAKKGLQTKEIARKLRLGPATINEFLRRGFDKLSIHSRRDLVHEPFLPEREVHGDVITR